jgi:hypothetical protein
MSEVKHPKAIKIKVELEEECIPTVKSPFDVLIKVAEQIAQQITDQHPNGKKSDVDNLDVFIIGLLQTSAAKAAMLKEWGRGAFMKSLEDSMDIATQDLPQELYDKLTKRNKEETEAAEASVNAMHAAIKRLQEEHYMEQVEKNPPPKEKLN